MDESTKLVKTSKRKALRNEGYVMQGDLYKDKVINIMKILDEDPETNGLFRLNEFIGGIEYTRAPVWNKNIKEGKRIDDFDEIFIKGWLAEKKFFEPNTSKISEALFLYSAKTNRMHPVKEYLESLKWDGKTRVDGWLHKVTGSDDNIYTSLVGRKMLCAMVQRIYNPGCQFDNLIVLEGKEGIYKTTMLRILGGKWYAPFSIKAESKDAVDVMSGKWLLEMEELATLRGSEIEYVDAFLSRNVDRVRLSYRRNAQDFPRQCVFVGTMNPIGDNQYLKKQSENRRFWPIVCKKKIEINWLKENRDQLFAETMQIYKNEAIFLDNEEAVSISIEEQEDRKPQDSWIENIDMFLTGKDVVTPNEIMTQCLKCEVSKITHANLSRVGVCMRHLRWMPKQKGPNKKKYYTRPDADINDINDGIKQIDWEG